MASTPLAPCFIQIPATDVERAEAFYKAVLSFSFNARDSQHEDPMVFFHFKGTPLNEEITGGIMKLPDELMSKHRPMGEAVFFYTDEIDEVAERVTKNGGRVLYKRKKVTHGWITGFVDTEGNCHGLYTSTGPK